MWISLWYSPLFEFVVALQRESLFRVLKTPMDPVLVDFGQLEISIFLLFAKALILLVYL